MTPDACDFEDSAPAIELGIASNAVRLAGVGEDSPASASGSASKSNWLPNGHSCVCQVPHLRTELRQKRCRLGFPALETGKRLKLLLKVRHCLDAEEISSVRPAVKNLVEENWEAARLARQLIRKPRDQGDIAEPVVKQDAARVLAGPVVSPSVPGEAGLKGTGLVLAGQ